MGAMILPSVGILLNITLVILFFSKEHQNNKETKIYSKLLIINICFLIVGIITFLLAKITNDLFLVEIFQKIYMSILIILNYFSIKYCLSFFHTNINNSKIINYLNIFLAIVFIIATIILPLKVIFYNDVLDGEGLSYMATFIYSVISFAIFIIFTFYLVVTKQELKKVIPFLSLLILYLVGFILREAYHELIFEGFFFSYILLLMYFTIENPDVKMLEKIERAKLHAEQANRAKSDFLSSMSHEIRTPLNAIVGFSEDIRDYIDEGDTTRIKEDADLIVSSSETLLEIVGNIIDISKIESEKLDIIEKVYNPKEEIERLTKATATRIGDKPIDFHLSIAPDIPYELIGDSGKVKQVINNLLTNSIKYTEQGEINLRIECINQDNISVLKITCQDTGRGIKKENIEKLFNKFERLDIERNTTTEGTGLGLAITKSIVEMMGGKINVQSQFGEGSIFIAQIPQKIQTLMSPVENVEEISTPIKETHIEEQPRIISSESNNNIKKVLIVDDNKLNITVAKKVLDEIVDEVESVMSGQECLDKINAGEKYDVILMDIMMPEMSGETTFKKLQEISGFDIPVIALTADAESTSRAKYLSEGFNDYIAKPFKKDEIKSILDKYSSTDIAEENTKESIEPEIKTEPIKYDPNIDRFEDAPRYEITGDGVKEVDKNDIETL